MSPDVCVVEQHMSAGFIKTQSSSAQCDNAFILMMIYFCIVLLMVSASFLYLVVLFSSFPREATCPLDCLGPR